MKRFNTIIMQKTEPVDRNVLWLKDGELLMYEGGWKPALKETLVNMPRNILNEKD